VTTHDEDDDANAETEEDEIVQEVRRGVHFLRHSKKHVTVGRLELDDALKQLADALKQLAEDADAAARADATAARASRGGDGDGGGGGGGGEGGVGDATEPVAACAALADLMIGWSEARIKAWNGRTTNENAHLYRFNAPGEAQSKKGWSPEEHQLFMDTLAKCPGGKADYVWGMFSKNVPGRVGYQCSNYYRTLVESGTVVDSNYMVGEDGNLRFKFKNKGFKRPEKKKGGGGGSGGGGSGGEGGSGG
jgi:hypothetical protein